MTSNAIALPSICCRIPEKPMAPAMLSTPKPTWIGCCIPTPYNRTLPGKLRGRRHGVVPALPAEETKPRQPPAPLEVSQAVRDAMEKAKQSSSLRDDAAA
ncbi:hypothetical protein [Sphingomonas sp.]|uniref:hypothetical protein n=1 Tax=Sphingomonas sp. TaxID=28214 RepID=UPI0035B1FC12